MAAKKNYSRYFIILQEDEKGYSTDSNKFPTGYTKVEKKNSKCKVSYYVQNLKKSNNPYYMVLICNRKNDKRLVKLGAINIDNYGRAEVSYEYDADNVANVNIPMDTIKGAAIVKLEDSTVHGILTGFINGEEVDEWRSYAIIENKENQRSEGTVPLEKEEKNKGTVPLKEEVPIEDNIFDKYEKDIEESKNIGDSPLTVKENVETKVEIESTKTEATKTKEVNREVNKEADQDEEVNEEVDKNKEESKEELKEDITYDAKEIVKEKELNSRKNKENKKSYKENKEEKEHKELDVMNKFFSDLVEGLEEVKGVCPELGNCKWYKVKCEDLANSNPYVDFNKYTMVYYPMFNYYPYISRHGHYLMGYKYDKDGRVRYLIYAIPGTKAIYDQPFGGATGFVTWVYRKSDEEKDNNLGYWAMFYDFKNSTVVVPVKR